MNKFNKQKLNKRNMTTNKRNQYRTGQLSTHTIFFNKQLFSGLRRPANIRGAGRRAQLMYVTSGIALMKLDMSMNLKISQQQRCVQFTLRTKTMIQDVNSAFSPGQSALEEAR